MNSVAGRLLALLYGPLLCVGLYCLLPSNYADSAGHSVVFSAAARWTVGCIAWMAVWWRSEAVPLAATSLLPGMLFPMLGVANLGDRQLPQGWIKRWARIWREFLCCRNQS